MTSAVVSHAVSGMPEEASDFDSSSWSNDDEPAYQLKEVVRIGSQQLRGKECQRGFAKKFIDLFRREWSLREADGTLLIRRRKFDLTDGRDFQWQGYILL